MVNYERSIIIIKNQRNEHLKMADDDNKRDIRTLISRFRKSNNWGVSLVRDLIWIVAVVGGIALVLFLICGTWPAVVTIESQSMVPHMNVGDLVIVVQKDRFGELQTWAQGNITGYRKFGDYGDVIIYQPNGAKNPVVPIPFISSGVHPIIHRAMVKADISDLPEYLMLDLENISKFYLPHGGYITKGDNNKNIDQVAVYQGLGVIEPVKDEWILGKALFTIPLVGYLPLHIVEVTIFIIVIMILHELYLQSREGKTKKPQKKTGKKQR
jgi:signal peptidase